MLQQYIKRSPSKNTPELTLGIASRALKRLQAVTCSSYRQQHAAALGRSKCMCVLPLPNSQLPTAAFDKRDSISSTDTVPLCCLLRSAQLRACLRGSVRGPLHTIKPSVRYDLLDLCSFCLFVRCCLSAFALHGL